MDVNPTEHKLLIEFVYKQKRLFFNRAKYIIQNKPFKFGLKIKNIDDKNSPKAKIKNLCFKSANGGIINQNYDEDFTIKELRPGEEITLWWPDEISTVMKEEIWLECIVESEDDEKNIFNTFQYNSHSKKEEPYLNKNMWGDALFIHGELEHQQATTNFLTLILTILVFLDGVWGLDVIAINILDVVGWIFTQISRILISLV